MKKLSNRTIALIAVIAVLGITVLTLGLIPVKQDKYFFDGYESFAVYNLDSASPLPKEVNEKIEPKLKTTGFSVLSAMLEGQFGYSPTIVTDEDDEPIYLGQSDIEGMKATSERYLLYFSYSTTKTIKLDGTTYSYNRAFVEIRENSGEIGEMRVVPYVQEDLHNGDGDNSTEFLQIPDVRIKMRTSKLYVAIANAIDEFLA